MILNNLNQIAQDHGEDFLFNKHLESKWIDNYISNNNWINIWSLRMTSQEEDLQLIDQFANMNEWIIINIIKLKSLLGFFGISH